MSKKRVSIRDRMERKGLQMLSKAPTKPDRKEAPREIETKKSRNLYQQANFQLYPEQAKKIRIYAAQNNMKISEVVRQALDEFFESKGL